MFRLFIVCGFIGCISVDACNELPYLCVEESEGPNLVEAHEWLKTKDRVLLLPKSKENIDGVYKNCWKDNHLSTSSVVEIESELEARLKDKNLSHIKHYVDVMWRSMRLFQEHADKNFSRAFFQRFFGDVNCFLLGIRGIMRDNPDAIKKSHLLYVVKSISDMWDEFLGFDDEGGSSFFDMYKQLHLTGEYWQSEEGQNMINVVTGALSEGFSLK